MKIGLLDIDSKIPNLALMKISTFHNKRNDTVEFYSDRSDYDTVYASKVFTWSEDWFAPVDSEKGGSGFNLETELKEEIEHCCPNYDLYGIDYSIGFLTRGCIRNCSFCIVPKKEGKIRAHADFTEFVRHDKALFLDNNVLSHPHGIEQIETLAGQNIKVDFNQGLDARLINDAIAKRLSKLKWWHPLRLACDTAEQIPAVEKAVRNLRWHNTTPVRYFCYVLVTEDIEDALERTRFLKALNLDPFAQPYRDQENHPPSAIQRHFARWVNHKAEFKSRTWEEYRDAHL